MRPREGEGSSRSSRAKTVLLVVLLAGCRGRAESTPETATVPPDSAPTDAAAPVALPTATASTTASSVPSPVDAGPTAPRVVLVRGARIISVQSGQLTSERPTTSKSPKGQGAALTLGTVGHARHDEPPKLTATVGRFLARPEYLDVSVSEASDIPHSYSSKETHYVLDTSGPDDVLVCVFPGTTISSHEYFSSSSRIAVKQTARTPLAFSVTTTSSERRTQPVDHAGSSESSRVAEFQIGAPSCGAPSTAL